MEKFFPSIPAKRYFTISEVSVLCGVKPHVLRYWEQEFTQLRPMKRRGNRRYYQRHEVLMIRKIRELLYGQGFTIIGARSKLQEFFQIESDHELEASIKPNVLDSRADGVPIDGGKHDSTLIDDALPGNSFSICPDYLQKMRQELLEIRDLLGASF